eukprot:6187982-Pleurochrysis_carterae.AAC.3
MAPLSPSAKTTLALHERLSAAAESIRTVCTCGPPPLSLCIPAAVSAPARNVCTPDTVQTLEYMARGRRSSRTCSEAVPGTQPGGLWTQANTRFSQ